MVELGHISKEQVIPKEYIPMKQLVFCGNKVSNYQYLISDNGFYPILIGDGAIPRIWIFAKMPNKEFMTVVEDSVSNINQIKIDIRSSENKIEIKDTVSNIIILKLIYDDIPSIIYMDLKPIGYLIHGDETKLMIGNNTLHGNTISNVQTVIGLETKQSPSQSSGKPMAR